MSGEASRQNGKKGGRPRKRPLPAVVEAVGSQVSDNQHLRIGEGRPGPGRPEGSPHKVSHELRAYAKQYSKESIRGLRKIAKDPGAPHAARVAAYREILDRGEGRPTQAITGPDGSALQMPPAILFVVHQQVGAENRT